MRSRLAGASGSILQETREKGKLKASSDARDSGADPRALSQLL